MRSPGLVWALQSLPRVDERTIALAAIAVVVVVLVVWFVRKMQEALGPIFVILLVFLFLAVVGITYILVVHGM